LPLLLLNLMLIYFAAAVAKPAAHSCSSTLLLLLLNLMLIYFAAAVAKPAAHSCSSTLLLLMIVLPLLTTQRWWPATKGLSRTSEWTLHSSGPPHCMILRCACASIIARFCLLPLFYFSSKKL
jgi:hypothetical protein